MKKKFSLIFGILLTGILVNTSHSSPYWAKVYWGTSEYWGSHDEGIEQVRQTTDFGYILAGYSRSFTATGEAGWLFKLNQKGDVVWGKTYTGSYTDKFKDVQQTLDGGYIVAGFTHIPGAGRSDAWILKLNSSGEIIWQKTYGEDEYNYAYSIQQTSDGGYIVAGTMDVDPNNNGNYDSWILKLDPNGDILWQRHMEE